MVYITSFQLGGNQFRCSWKNERQRHPIGHRLGSSSGYRLAPAGKKTLRSVLTGRWTHGEKPQRVKGSCCAQSPLYTQWPRLKSIRGRQYRNASRAGHGDIRSQTHAVSGIAALVTTPLRPVVTRALRVRQALRQAFACHNACFLSAAACLRIMISCPLGSTGAAGRGPALGARV